MDPRKQTPGGRHQIGIPAGFKSESVAGFLLECVAGFVGIRMRPLLLAKAAGASCRERAVVDLRSPRAVCLRPEDIPALGGGLRRVRGGDGIEGGLSTAERWPTHALRSIREIGPCDGPRHNDGLSGLRMGNVGYPPSLGSFHPPHPCTRVGTRG